MNQSRRKFIKSTGAAAGALAFLAFLLVKTQRQTPEHSLSLPDQQHWQAQGSVDPFFDTLSQDALSAESTVLKRFLYYPAMFAQPFLHADRLLPTHDGDAKQC